nr:MAG TPA: hypothetical protein [Caudoviricetes sp.]
MCYNVVIVITKYVIKENKNIKNQGGCLLWQTIRNN